MPFFRDSRALTVRRSINIIGMALSCVIHASFFVRLVRIKGERVLRM